ncbi:hypothetical protein N7474_006729 [Penicillium riverlandense]|uniref:uncharacterized protein n=1 Tax=Penicillium riverlandense TaxID=1903569 RepID=UPI002548DB8F|nr:uncharacterized protein N7474_006729 [Penicillium riverlandense]KAJ5814952.1 hypothetical protein N7474_006729 [Penicillium riverlandense]
MVYSAVDQVDYDQASNASSSASRDPSPAPGHASPPSLGHFIHSLTSTDYEIVEDDDYTAADPTSERGSRHIPPLDTTVAQHSSSDPDPPLRSASSDIPIPLSHPTPDLQSLQGAYLGNVERLEQSAEQLSSSSVDIESEIRRIDQEQKRRSCSSASNSMILRNGTFSPVAASLSSPHGSILSASRQRSASGSYLAHVSKSIHDEDGDFSHPIPLPVIPSPQTSAYASNDLLYQNHYDAAVAAIERPSTAASNDTYQEARTLFTDFDGVHFSPLDPANSLARRISLTRPPLASKPESYKEPQTGEHMVYYPAPVPRMLNLPPKLSRKPLTDREKRRTQLVGSVPAENRKSTAWLPGSDQPTKDDHQNKRRQSTPLPQLPASVFLEQQQPTSSLDVKVKQDSAVATLESILDASACAPVSAFTDHPIAGHIGSYVYARARGKETKNKWNTMGQRQSTNNGSEHEDSGDERHPNDDLNEMHEGSDTQEHSGDGEPDQEEEEEEFFDYVGPPNTLLAELELRKHEMQQRRRTRPTHGMQATLLELDAMAQKQHAKRRQRPVTLAWDSRDTADDDEVPLAMLYPDKTEAEIEEEERPAGLMEKRQLEENEPLSTRRARLRGEPIPQPDNPATAVYESEIIEREGDSDEEGETLAERLRRLRGQDPADSEFANELLAEFDTRLGVAPKDDIGPEVDKEADHIDNDNETLAQRRSRLQKESGGAQRGNINPNKAPRAHRSMAALPQTRASHVPVARKSSHDLLNPYANPHMSMPMFMPMQQFSHHAMAMGYPMPPMGYPMMMPQQAQGMMYPNAYPYNQLMMGMNGMYANGCGPNMARPPTDPTQRDMIDRWRQSIR